MSGSLSSAEGELNAIVKEYLEHLKLEETLLTFEEECRKTGKPIQDHAGKNRRDAKILKVQKELLAYFDAGQRMGFFTSWEAHINSDVLDSDQSCQKLEFMLHVHFAVFPLRKTDHWDQEEVEEAMFHFRYYLETKGAYLSSCPELLPFFGLPYVKCPSSHPSFTEVFKHTWVLEVRKKLEAFVWDHLKKRWQQNPSGPRLVDLYNKNDFHLKELQNELKQMENRLESSEKCYIVQTKKMDKLQEECQQMMSVASLLVTALESAVKGNIIDLDCVLSSCTEHFPDVAKLKKTAKFCENKTENDLGKTDQPFKSSSVVNSPYRKNSPTLEFDLDFNKIKSNLCCCEEKNQLLLLQALRWRLTRSDSFETRKKTLLSYIGSDILDLFNHSSNEKVFHLLKSDSIMLRQSMTRFLNAFASFSKGREYLSKSPDLLQCLVDNLLIFKSDDVIIRDMSLGTLQKLSTRSEGQNFMIDASMMEWLSEILSRPDQMTDYSLEYSTALLMNLCLCTNGRKKCESIKEDLLLVLCELLKLEQTNIIGYVNGALYSILSVPSIKEYAIEQHLEDTLLTVMEKSEPEIKRQLECIQELLHCSGGESESCSSAEDDVEGEGETDLESELDLNDPVASSPNEAFGEHLLWKEYSLSGGGTTSFPKTNARKSSTEKHLKVLKTPESQKKIGVRIPSRASLLRSSSVPPESNQSLLAKGEEGSHASSEPVTPKLDVEATQLVRKIVGQPSTTLVEAAALPNPASINIKGLNVNEYMVAFSSRPKIPRTPELSPGGSKRNRMRSTPTPVNDSGDRSYTYSSENNDLSRMSPKIAACSPP